MAEWKIFMKQCNKCGCVYNDTQSFCGQCGNKLDATPQQPHSQPNQYSQNSSQYNPYQQSYYTNNPYYIQKSIEEQQKHNKKATRKTIIIIVSIFIIFTFFAIIGASDDDTPTNSSNTVANASDDAENKSLIDNKYELKLLDSSVVKDYDERKVLVVTFDFSNLTDEATSFSYSLAAKAFDDGVELDTPISMYGIDGYDFHNNDLDIKPGKSIQVQKAYYLNSDTKEVEIEISPWISFNDEVYKTFKITVD